GVDVPVRHAPAGPARGGVSQGARGSRGDGVAARLLRARADELLARDPSAGLPLGLRGADGRGRLEADAARPPSGGGAGVARGPRKPRAGSLSVRGRLGLPVTVRPKWIMLMAGPELRVHVRDNLDEDRFRLLTATSPIELDRRLRIVLPDLVLLEIGGAGTSELGSMHTV